MLQVLITIACFAVFLFLLQRWSRRQPSGLTLAEISVAFSFKVLTGFLYGYVFLKYFNGDDTWFFHNGSLDEQRKLLNDPADFFFDFDPVHVFKQVDSFATGLHYYLSDLEFFFISKVFALFNFISGGNYYTNSVLFNFFVMWGSLWLFQLYQREFPGKRQLLFIVIFFIPSVVFWLSGIRGDGYLFLSLSLLFVSFYQWLREPKRKSLVRMALALLGIVIFRNMVVLLVIPALAGWWLVAKKGMQPWRAVLLAYGSACIIFWVSLYISPAVNLPSAVVKRQQEYLSLHGKTRFSLDTLQAHPLSFARILPQAANNSFLRPYMWEAKGALQLMASVEIMIFNFLILFVCWKGRKNLKSHFSDPLILFTALFAVSLYLLIGYVVPYPGAIIRYKITAELFLLLAFITLPTPFLKDKLK